MVTLHWAVNEENGAVGTATLVELVVENSTEIPVRIRVGNCLDGEIQPPRRNGVMEAGWDEGGFEGVVREGERLALGYAVATDSNDESPPAEIVWTERAPQTEKSADNAGNVEYSGDSLDSGEELDIEPTAAGVVRALGEARPPADVVPTPDRTELPDAVESWLSTVETRIERYEAGDRGVKLKTVAEQVREQELSRRVAVDGRALDSVAKRIDRLQDRISAREAREAHVIEETI